MDVDITESRGMKRPLDEVEGPRKPKKIRVRDKSFCVFTS